MATSRLCNMDREDICNELEDIVNRTITLRRFPIPYGEDNKLRDFIFSCIKPKIITSWCTLMDDPEASDLVDGVGYFEGRLCNADKVYSISGWTHGKVPSFVFTIPEGHPEFMPILKWAQQQAVTKGVASTVNSYIHTVIHACSSAGQIKRVLPDCVRYLSPTIRESLGEAERQSRVPAGICLDVDMENLTMVTIATGSLITPPEWKESRRMTKLDDVEERTA